MKNEMFTKEEMKWIQDHQTEIDFCNFKYLADYSRSPGLNNADVNDISILNLALIMAIIENLPVELYLNTSTERIKLSVTSETFCCDINLNYLDSEKETEEEFVKRLFLARGDTIPRLFPLT